MTTNHQSGSILLVEDDRSTSRVMSDLLRDMGFTTISARNGKIGLELYRKRRPNIGLIITDYSMPVMNGTRLIQAIRESGDKIPIVLFTASDLDEKEALLSGATRLLRKPCDSESIETCVKEMLEVI